MSHTADVFFDNEFVVHHYNAYTPFDGIVKNVSAGQHTIRVEADNSFSEASALHKPNDYFTYGGIIRSCAFEMLGDCYIKNVKFTPVYNNGKWMRESGAEDKPIIMSEFGGAALYGYRDSSRRKWSEECQADIIDNCLELYMNSPETAGVFIWQFADCRVTDEGGWFFSRARCHNNKGIFDEYRRPKLAAEIVKKHFKK